MYYTVTWIMTSVAQKKKFFYLSKNPKETKSYIRKYNTFIYLINEKIIPKYWNIVSNNI